MKRKDSIGLGILVGLIVPVVGYGLLLLLGQWLEVSLDTGDAKAVSLRPRTLAVLALCFNLLPVAIFQRNKHFESIRGMIFPTVGYAVAWLVLFGKYVL